MVGRMWRAWATADSADAYEHLLRTEILPELDAVDGCLGAYVMRRALDEDVEFVVLHFFESIDAVRRFAGDEYETAVVPEPARKLLARFDATSAHYEVRAEPTPASS
ncbi:MAG TPA: antibiotic biosynthesis monooxygenase [Trebonia sp.]